MTLFSSLPFSSLFYITGIPTRRLLELWKKMYRFMVGMQSLGRNVAGQGSRTVNPRVVGVARKNGMKRVCRNNYLVYAYKHSTLENSCKDDRSRCAQYSSSDPRNGRTNDHVCFAPKNHFCSGTAAVSAYRVLARSFTLATKSE